MSQEPETVAAPELSPEFNPVWLRELWLYGRSQRMPLTLAALTVIATLVVCSVGAVASFTQEPARVGSLLYQVFFATAFAWVTWVGAGIAATFVATEKNSSHWDLLIVSGVSARKIARGSFMASLTWVMLCLAMLSPVASVSFLFGGVSPAEITWAFVGVAVSACLAVGFGTAVGAIASTPASAMLIAVPTAALLSMLLYGLGFVSSFMVDLVWPVVTGGMPLWWPTALARAEGDLYYWFVLVCIPLLFSLIACWLFYEMTVASLSEQGEDRSTRLRIWFIVCGVMLYSVAAFTPLWLPTEHGVGYAISLSIVTLFSLFGLYILAGDDTAPSARVLGEWSHRHAGTWQRFCGPGVVRAVLTVCLLAAFGIGLQWLVALLLELRAPASGATLDLTVLVLCDGYVLAFVCFLAGFVAHVRARSISGATPRLLLTFVLLTIAIGPWILASVFGMVDTFGATSMLLVASPSPAFVVALAYLMPDEGSLPGGLMLAGLLASVAWLALGFGLLYTAQRHIERENSPPQRDSTPPPPSVQWV